MQIVKVLEEFRSKLSGNTYYMVLLDNGRKTKVLNRFCPKGHDKFEVGIGSNRTCLRCKWLYDQEKSKRKKARAVRLCKKRIHNIHEVGKDSKGKCLGCIEVEKERIKEEKKRIEEEKRRQEEEMRIAEEKRREQIEGVLIPNLKDERIKWSLTKRDLAKTLFISVKEVEELENQQKGADPVIIQRVISLFAHLRSTDTGYVSSYRRELESVKR